MLIKSTPARDDARPVARADGVRRVRNKTFSLGSVLASAGFASPAVDAAALIPAEKQTHSGLPDS